MRPRVVINFSWMKTYLREVYPQSRAVPRNVERVGQHDDVVRSRFLPHRACKRARQQITSAQTMPCKCTHFFLRQLINTSLSATAISLLVVDCRVPAKFTCHRRATNYQHRNSEGNVCVGHLLPQEIHPRCVRAHDQSQVSTEYNQRAPVRPGWSAGAGDSLNTCLC